MTLTIKLDGNWNSFQLANSAPPLSVTDSAIAPSARITRLCVSVWLRRVTMHCQCVYKQGRREWKLKRGFMSWRNAVAPKVEKLVRRKVGSQGPRKNLGSHIDASHSRQPLVKGERLMRHEVNAVMHSGSCYSFCLI